MKKVREFLIGDTHFYDASIILYENRNFDDVNLMNNTMIENWNSLVTNEDIVYVNGDFMGATGFTRGKAEEILEQLNGYKVLIMGNHDMHLTPKEWIELGFDEVSKYPIIVNDFIIISHEPLYMNVNSPYVNIFSHVHGNPTYNDVSCRSACVSVERINYTPILLNTILSKIKQMN